MIFFIGQSLSQTRPFFSNSDRFVSQMGISDFLNAYTGYFGGKLFVNALWFLRDLIVWNVLSTTIKRIIDKFPFFYMCILIILWEIFGTNLSIVLDTQSICFFSLGYYAVKYNIHINRIDSISNNQLLFAYVIAIFLEFYMYLLNSPLMITAHSLSVLLGIALIIKGSKYLLNNITSRLSNLMLIVSEYSFFICVSHDFIQTVLKKISLKVFPEIKIIQFCEYLFIPIVTCCICIVIGVIIKK